MRSRNDASLVLAALVLFAVACSEDDDPTEVPDPPTVSGISASTVAPGDTLVISGANFATPASGNQVRFTNPLGVANAFDGDANEIRVVVDQDATDGPITVSNANGSATGPAVTVTRGIGDFFVFGGLGSGNVLSLPNPAVATQYLVVPYGTNAVVDYEDDYGYLIETGTVVANAHSGPTRSAGALQLGARERFDLHRWEATRELVERVGTPQRGSQRDRAQVTGQAPRNFVVLNTADPDADLFNPASYDQITAELRYTGTKCLVYADIDTSLNPANNFDQIHFTQFGQAFDNSIEPTNVANFGGYSDVDGNGKVIILITPGVNRLTPTIACGGGPGACGFIAGFFLSIDLFPVGQVPSGTTNHAEVFYLLAADPQSEFTPGFPAFPIDATAEENIGTTAHEHEHMISFSERLFNQGGFTQEAWLEEGMAHMAEDLNDMHDSNMARADLYLQDPAAISLEDPRTPLNQRGGMYLFLRLMADREGIDILMDIVQSRCRGRACIEAVTGRRYDDLLGEFFAALYLSGKGITDDDRFNFDSIDLDDYGTVTVYPRVAGDQPAGTVRKSSGDLYLFNGVTTTDTEFTFTETVPGVRLRNAIVRVQ